MSKSAPKGIAEILETLKAETQLGKSLEEARIFQEWPGIAGTELAPYGRPLAIREETLIVEADSAVWLHKFAYHKAQILARIEAIVGPDLVTEIFLALTEEEKLSDPENES